MSQMMVDLKEPIAMIDRDYNVIKNIPERIKFKQLVTNLMP